MAGLGQTRTYRVCKTCIQAGFTDGRCVYCGVTLAARHEHDHMPVPRRAGGKAIAPTCLNCHDLKDRSSFADWDQDEFLKQMGDAPPLMRIVLAGLLAELHTLTAERFAAEERTQVVW